MSTTSKAARAGSVLIVGMAVAFAGGIISPSTAAAVTGPIRLTANVNLRPTTDTTQAPLALMPSGTSPDYVCWTRGASVNGLNVWFKVNYADKTGYYASYYDDSSYSSADLITSKYGIAQCGTTPPATAPAPDPAPAPAPAPSVPASGPYIVGSAGGRSCINTGNPNCNPFEYLADSTPVTMVCWMDGSSVSERYSSPRWFLVRRGDGWEAFVHSSRVVRQASAPWCGNVPRVKAGLAAINRVGEAKARPSDVAQYPGLGQWATKDKYGVWRGYEGEWSGDCKKLAGVAWNEAGTPLVRGNAKPTMDYYLVNATIKGTGRYPQYGALAGFNQTSLGHIAVAIGGDRVATTNGMDGDNLRNSVKNISSMSAYRGWALPN